MADGRMLKKNVSTSRKLAGLSSDSARLLWTWLLPHLDVAGRFSGEASVVRGAVVPRLKHFTEEKVDQLLQELHASGLIRLYEVGGERYLGLVRFGDFQNLRTDRESESKIPDSIDDGDNSGSTPGVRREDDSATCVSSYKDKDKDTLKIKINFNLKRGAWGGITDDDMKSWAEAYPACDLKIELAKMREWLIANPTKAVKSNWRRFITNWLSRSQDRGGTLRTVGKRDDFAALDAWAAKGEK